MTVADLIKLLADMPRDAKVVIDRDGYIDDTLWDANPVILEVDEYGRATATNCAHSEANGVLI